MSETDPIVPPDVGPPPGGVLDEHVPCDGCEYDLYGLPVGGCCPECGAGVRASIVAHRGRQRGLSGADPRWLAGLVRGILAMLVAVVVAVVISTMVSGLGRTFGFGAGGWWHLMGWGLTAYAVWQLGVPARGSGAVSVWSRSWPVVAALLPVAAIGVLNTAGDAALRGAVTAVFPWLALAPAAATVWVFERLAAVARRVPRYTLAAHCRFAGSSLALMSLVVTAMLFWHNRIGGRGDPELLILMPTAGLDHAGLAPILFAEFFRVIERSGSVVWQYYVWLVEPVVLVWASVVLVVLAATIRKAAREARTRAAITAGEATPAARG